MEFLKNMLSGDHGAILRLLAPGAWVDLQSVGSAAVGLTVPELLLLQQRYFEKRIVDFEVFQYFKVFYCESTSAA